MGGHKIHKQNALHYLTFTVVGWIDIFTREKYKHIIKDSLEYCIQEKGLVLYAYVLMTNHLHLIISTDNEKGLSAIVRDFKTHTSKTVIKELIIDEKESRREWMLKLFKYYAKYNKRNTTYQFWKQDNRPIELSSRKWIVQKLDYIHLNLIRAGVVEHEEDYVWSSAKDYTGKKSVIKVELLDIGSGIGDLNI